MFCILGLEQLISIIVTYIYIYSAAVYFVRWYMVKRLLYFHNGSIQSN